MSNCNDFERLLPQHRKLIEASGVSSQVAQARGYLSVRSKSELERRGFGRAQRQTPALLIPVYSVHGEIALYQIRPDSPRIVKGKPLKYETPLGARMALDVHPFAREMLGNPEVPLFVTEGVRKADAAVAQCLCCIALLGVWNWRGSNEHRGKVALPDWESIALKARMVYIVFDADVMTKPEVNNALARLKTFLESRGANVNLVYLPPNQNGSKVGLDDYLAAGHSVEDLLALASPELRASAEAQTSPTSPYLIENGRICIEKDTRDGQVIQPLCNFDARVAEELTLDDGEGQTREFLIRGTLMGGKQLPLARVPTDRFAAMGWIANSWGVDAVPAAGLGKKDQLREAIQRLSGDAIRRRIYTHTGWREIDGEYCYLTATGAIGRTDIEVDLGRELSRYELPRDPVDVVESVRLSLKLLDVADTSVTAPLWAAVYRTPLASVLPLDLSVWLEGFTGSLKSTVSALFLSHWGRFDRTNLPGSWSSTTNHLEKRAYMLKDALFVVDDYAPTFFDGRELATKAARLLRSQGNLAGRGRLQSDLRERKTYFPRGLILSTGEQRPPGQSILARGFLLDLERRHVDLDRLTMAQSRSGELAAAMAGYVRWLAPQMKTMKASLATAFEAARGRAASVGTHLRHPEALAHLWLGLDCGLAFAEEIGAVDFSEASDLKGSCWEALVERAKVMGQLVEEDKPTRRFAEILTSLILQKRIGLLPRDAARSGQQNERFIGWRDDEYLYLVPDASFRAVSQFARDSSEPFPVGQRRLQQDLVREGIADHAEGRTTTTARVGGRVQRVLRLRRAGLSSLVGQELPDSELSVTDVTDVTGFVE